MQKNNPGQKMGFFNRLFFDLQSQITLLIKTDSTRREAVKWRPRDKKTPVKISRQQQNSPGHETTPAERRIYCCFSKLVEMFPAGHTHEWQGCLPSLWNKTTTVELQLCNTLESSINHLNAPLNPTQNC